MGFLKGRSGSSPLWSNTGIQTPCLIKLDSERCAVARGHALFPKAVVTLDGFVL